LATLNVAVGATGGDIVYLPKFNSERHGEKLYYELFRCLTRPVASNVMVKARCSTGLSVTEYFGGFGVTSTKEFSLSSLDADKTFGFTIQND